MITASHNPARYNGIKYKAPYGGSASTQITGAIEEELRSIEKERPSPPDILFEKLVESGDVRLMDVKEDYLENVMRMVDADAIRGCGVRVVFDPMYGAGQGYLSELLKGLDVECKEIHNLHDCLFGGINPEPFGENMNELRDEVVGKYDVGVAVDGDADRACAIDVTGEFISSHKIFSLLLQHLVEHRGWRGKVVKTVSTTSMIDKLCRRYGMELEVVPVGFKYICDLMLAGNVLIGGEESGGVGIMNYIPERDGILMGLLLVEVMACRGKNLGELVRDLIEDVGEHHYVRRDIEIEAGVKEKLLEELPRARPDEIGGVKVEQVVEIDGRKFIREDGSWLMLRVSGTEAVVRVYAEADSPEEASRLAVLGEEFIGKLTKGG